MVRKTKADTEQTRRDIIEAARRVFSERGVSRTTLEQVATSAGVTRGAIYWHFANKVELFMALRDDVAMPLMDRLEAALQVEPGGDPLDAIERFLLAHIERMESDAPTRQTFEVMITKCEYTGEFGEALRCVIRKSHNVEERLQHAYRRAAEEGSMRAGLDPEAMALDTFTFLFGLVRIWVGDGADGCMRERAREMISNHVAIRRAR